MKDYDGDAEYEKLQSKINKNETLDEEDILKLIFLPLMKSKQTEDEMAIQAAELAKDIEGEIKTFIIGIIGAIIAVTDKFMSEEYKNRLLEVLRMTQIEQWIREEGKKEGKMETAKAALREGAEEDFVAKITGLPKDIIKKLKREIN